MSRHRMPPGGANTPKKDDETASTAEEIVESAGTEVSEATEPATPDPATTEPALAEPVEETEAEESDAAEEAEPETETEKRRINWTRVLAYGILPGLALVLAMAAGYLKWQDNSVRDSDKARAESMQVAKDSTVRMLSYKPESVDKDLNGARDLLTGEFRDEYTSLINDVVIPGAQQKKISAVATVPAAGSVSADPNKAVVLLFVNQTVVVGQDAPTDTASTVRVTLEKSGDRWLISKFDPV